MKKVVLKKLSRGPLHSVRTPSSDIKPREAVCAAILILTWGRLLKGDILMLIL
jgi:hypothetical protein